MDLFENRLNYHCIAIPLARIDENTYYDLCTALKDKLIAPLTVTLSNSNSANVSASLQNFLSAGFGTKKDAASVFQQPNLLGGIIANYLELVHNSSVPEISNNQIDHFILFILDAEILDNNSVYNQLYQIVSDVFFASPNTSWNSCLGVFYYLDIDPEIMIREKRLPEADSWLVFNVESMYMTYSENVWKKLHKKLGYMFRDYEAFKEFIKRSGGNYIVLQDSWRKLLKLRETKGCEIEKNHIKRLLYH